jgi:hypothetical protein
MKKKSFVTKFATHYISTHMGVIGQVAWVARDVTHRLYDFTLV